MQENQARKLSDSKQIKKVRKKHHSGRCGYLDMERRSEGAVLSRSVMGVEGTECFRKTDRLLE